MCKPLSSLIQKGLAALQLLALRTRLLSLQPPELFIPLPQSSCFLIFCDKMSPKKPSHL